jgi:ring-1,2-phenylacetyl-CoA epoxidase subunit PaaA
LCNELQLKVPVYYDKDRQKYVIDCAFPAHFDARAKRWLLEDGPCTWDDVMKRWKARGPSNEEFVGMVQRGKKDMLRLLEQQPA